MEGIGILIVGASATAITGLLAFVVSLCRKTKRLRDTLARTEREKLELAGRLKPALDVEAEAASLRADLEKESREAEQQSAHIKAESDQLRERYAQGLKTYETLEAQIRKLEEDLEDIAYGLYKPHFTYSDTEAYKAAIQGTREKQKAMMKTGQAATCGTSWTVGGSKREGERMVKQYEKLILRAFNAESEAAIANVAWNNYRVMCQRMENTFDVLNKLGTVMQISLNAEYKETRLQELQLVFEAAEKKQQEREEQRRVRAEQREEERVQRELQREREEAEKDEAKYENALVRARRDMEKARDAEREAMLVRIRKLEADLAAAHDRKERAIAQAQLTKVGHVYIISNVGAFGEGVLKIGLTRRLNPEERVQELGDASVPFPFDIHALIYSENAPELETKLHSHFWDRRINWVNNRKEFFQVGLDEVAAVISECGLSAEVLAVPEAKEYRQTVAAIDASKRQPALIAETSAASRFPLDPFMSMGPYVDHGATKPVA
jgi:Domain of unknown function (DUF4041)/Meiotically up-regulated gene 113